MTLHRYIFSLSILVFLFSSCTKESTPEVIQEDLAYQVSLNVAYGSDPKQVFDLYLPKNRTLETKVMLLVHGGGWNAGSKSDMNEIKDLLRQEHSEIAVVNMNYRLADADNSPYPMQINDIQSVISHLKENRQEYQIGSKFGITGVSAGGHLALLYSYGFDDDNQVQMVCSIVGPTNLVDDAYINSTNEVLRGLIFQFGEDLDILEEASPLHNIKANSPPTILFYGAQDPLIPNSQGIALKDKLQELNVPYNFTLYPNSGHGWIGLDLLDTAIKLNEFIDLHL